MLALHHLQFQQINDEQISDVMPCGAVTDVCRCELRTNTQAELTHNISVQRSENKGCLVQSQSICRKLDW